MSDNIKGLMNKKYASKIIGIQFSLLSPEEIRKWLGVIEPQEELTCAEGGYDWILCKDILEHVPYENIEQQLEVFHKGGKRLFVIVPIGRNGKYLIEGSRLVGPR